MEPDPETLEAAASLGLVVERALGGRSSDNLLVRQGAVPMVLRRHRNQLDLTSEVLGESVAWDVAARSAARAQGWPTPAPVRQPWRTGGSWFVLEEFVAGEVRRTTPYEKAVLLERWHRPDVTAHPGLGPRPGALDPWEAVTAADAEALVSGCPDLDDRHWMTLRLAQVRRVAADLDRTATREVLVHGDLVDQNLVWQGDQLAGVIDFELATVESRVLDLVLVWRGRNDDVVSEYDKLDPLSDAEWRMLFVAWGSLLLSLCFLHLRRGKRPDQWELDCLRRTGPLLERLVR